MQKISHACVPQGSVLGPPLFTAYTSPVGGLISSHGVAYHKFADDIQLVIALNTTKLCARSSTSQTMHNTSVRTLFLRNGLQQVWGHDSGMPAQLRSAAAVSIPQAPLYQSRLSWSPSMWSLTATCALTLPRRCHQGVQPTKLVPCDTCVNIWLLKWSRPDRSTTATHCCMALLLQYSISCRELRTTSPGSSVSSADVFTLDRYCSLSTGCLSNSASSTK